MDPSKSNAAKNDQDWVEISRENIAGEAKSIGKRGMDALDDMTYQAGGAISNASDSIIAYTKENPVKALGMAAAVGVVAYALVNALRPARD
jgi:ElaB/YqjD/DUF883 family membrane-anchored ribosome-binding protein